MADKDKTNIAEPKPGGKTGADNDSAENGASKPADPARPDPTRFGDWEVNGRCVDF